jgi:hypothetical protein
MEHLTLESLLALREPGAEPGDAAAREHLRTCSGCQAEFERLHQRTARLRALPALRPARDQWPPVAERVQKERRRRRSQIAGLAGLAGLALAASVALALVIPGRPGVSASAAGEIERAMERSRALESALSQYNPEGRMLDGRTAGLAQGLEDRIARLDRQMEMAELLERQTREQRLLKLWRERVGLLDALVDVHVTHASNVGL